MSESLPIPSPSRSRIERFRIGLGAFVVDNFFIQLSRLAQLLPHARPHRHAVELVRDIPYRDSGKREHLLDVYRPKDRPGPLPVVFYVHGGGFRILSKDSHWLMGLAFARRGFLVFNINYRLAPRHPFPAAIEDTCEAFRWVAENAAAYQGDLSRLVFAGESAGGNLVTSLTLATCYRRPEPWARRVWETELLPRAVIPACGMLQVSDPGRFRRAKRLSIWIHDRLQEVADAYLEPAQVQHPADLELADPLLVLERGEAPHRPLPPFFAPVGTADPLLDDTRRLKAALDRLGALCDARYYRGEMHAFHAMLFRKHARQCWRDTYEFLERYITHTA